MLSAVLPSSCSVEAGFRPLQCLSLASLRVPSHQSLLFDLFDSCRNILFIVVPRNLDCWCVGACFLFGGVQDRPKHAIPALVSAPGECSSWVIGSQPSLASVRACPGTAGTAHRTQPLSLCCPPEGSCGHKLLGLGKYLHGLQVCGLAAAQAPGQDLPLARPPRASETRL